MYHRRPNISNRYFTKSNRKKKFIKVSVSNVHLSKIKQAFSGGTHNFGATLESRRATSITVFPASCITPSTPSGDASFSCFLCFIALFISNSKNRFG